MSDFEPYTYIQCPCVSNASRPLRCDAAGPSYASKISTPSTDDEPFDSRAPRSAYTIHPPSHLLYCEDCHTIRCPRCILEEIIMYYCPNCLFEVPSSTVKSEGTRCTRSCFQCPLCTSPLSVSSMAPPPSGLGAENVQPVGPYVLNCLHCNWSTAEIGIFFEKPNGIYAQLAAIGNGGTALTATAEKAGSPRDIDNRRASGAGIDKSRSSIESIKTVEAQFADLKEFYTSMLQTDSASSAIGLVGDYSFGSPNALSRIMGLYTSNGRLEKRGQKPREAFREARTTGEGIQLHDQQKDNEQVARIQSQGWSGTLSLTQKLNQHDRARFLDDVRPVPFTLRTRRSKRCRTCRHILTKPESKLNNVRFRIRLVATNYIPAIAIKPMHPQASTSSTVGSQHASSSSVRPNSITTSAEHPSQALLQPGKHYQYLLTFKNPLFDSVKVSLGTPSTTPGKRASKITILCPEFELGANIDKWDEALKGGPNDVLATSEYGTQHRRRARAEGGAEGHSHGAAEAGKVWDRGRNWVSIVVEVVPGPLSRGARSSTPNLKGGPHIVGERDVHDGDRGDAQAEHHKPSNLLTRDHDKDQDSERDPNADAGAEPESGEDIDILEIPVLIRLEWQESAAHDDAAGSVLATSLATTSSSAGSSGPAGARHEAGEKRELSYWAVLGLGSIAGEEEAGHGKAW